MPLRKYNDLKLLKLGLARFMPQQPKKWVIKLTWPDFVGFSENQRAICVCNVEDL